MTIKLAIFDVDGTLLRGDTACEWIARRLGRYDRAVELESDSDTRQKEAANRNEMADWYSGLTPEELMGGMERFPWAPSVFEGIQLLRDGGITVALASLGWDFVLERIGRELGINRFTSTGLDFETMSVTQFWGADKMTYAKQLSQELRISPSEITGIGDTSGDIHLLDYTGLGIYIGAELPSDKNYVHLPNADIRQVADAILNF